FSQATCLPLIQFVTGYYHHKKAQPDELAKNETNHLYLEKTCYNHERYTELNHINYVCFVYFLNDYNYPLFTQVSKC
ncbi:hypothetical protein ACUY36_004566, partial [Escherichia coli]